MIVIRDRRKRRIAYIADALGRIIYFPYLFRRRKQPADPKKILLLRLDHIGDVLLTTPAIRALRKKYPNAEIAILTSTLGSKVLEGNPDIDKVLVYDAPWVGHQKFSLLSTGNNADKVLIKKLKNERYDIAIDFSGDSRDYLFLLRKIKAKYTVGYGFSGFGFLLDKEVPYDDSRHAVDLNLGLAYALGADKESRELYLRIGKTEAAYAAKILGKNAGKQLIVGMHPGAAWQYRMWPKERFAELADYLISNFKARVVLVGSKEEKGLCDEIVKMSGNKKSIVNAAGRTDIKQLAALIKRCRLFICNDSAPMHVALAVKTPIIALFGPGHVKKFGPYGEHDIIIRSEMPCSPCGQVKCIYPENNCMARIKLEDVREKVSRMLS